MSKKKLNLSNNQKTFCFMTDLIPENGQETFLEAHQ